MRGGAAEATDPPSLPEQMARAARPRRPRKVRGPPVGCGTPAGPGWVSRRRAGPNASRPQRRHRGPLRAAPPPRTPHTDPGRPGGAARGPLPGRGEGRGGRAGAGDRLPSADPPGAGAVGAGRGLAAGGGGGTARVAVPRGPGRPGEVGGGRPREPEPGRRRAMSSGRRVGRGARGGPAGSTSAGPSWGRRANVGEGGRARDGLPGSRSARSAAKAGEGAARRSSHSPRGGKRRRRSRSPCSGWGAAAVGVPRPECESGPAGRSGPGGSGTAEGEGGPVRGGVARAGGDGGVGVSRRRLADPGPESPRRTEWRMQLPRPMLWRGGRDTEGGGGGDSEREPDRLPDLTPSSARVSGGRAGALRGSSGTVVRGGWTSSMWGCGARGARHCGNRSP